ncbi:MAG: DUF2064 domain-containing protein [Acidobacteriota bacterium]|nr:DUF2064 domain-containing protein [Acidobacteriota bacterium]
MISRCDLTNAVPHITSLRDEVSARRALLVFANPAEIDCDRRRWPRSFRQLFKVDRFAALASDRVDVHVVTPFAPPASEILGCQVHIQDASGQSFGARLQRAVDAVLAQGYEQLVIVGSDCPSLGAADVNQAFALLDQKQVVLGPDHRGGCYLIGVHAASAPDFRTIRWHQNSDFHQLLARFGRQSAACLAEKIDLDTLEDLRLLASSLQPGWQLAAALLATLAERGCFAASRCRSALGRHLTLSWQLPPPAFSIA